MTKAKYKTLNRFEDVIMHNEILPYVKAKYENGFDTLIIPEVVSVDLIRRCGCVVWYDGINYNNDWGHEDGGVNVCSKTSEMMIKVVSDLKKIDVLEIENIFLRRGVVINKFNILCWKNSLDEKMPKLKERNHFTDEDIEKMKALEIDSDFIFSNGDFYIRNIIKVAERAVLVDWDHFDGFRCCYIDHISNVIAFSYVHMWGNQTFMDGVLAHKNQFNISDNTFDSSVVVKAVEQYLFLKDSDGCDKFCQRMACIAKSKLDSLSV